MTEQQKKRIAETLRELRGERKQKEVADAVGVSNMAMSQYESGKRIPNDTIKMKIAKFYGTTVEHIFFAG